MGGELTNDHIKNAIDNNNFLLSNCTIAHIEECEIYIEELVEYYNVFSKQKEQKLNLKVLDERISQSPVYLTFRKENQSKELIEKVDAALTKAKESGKLHDLSIKYFGVDQSQ